MNSINKKRFCKVLYPISTSHNQTLEIKRLSTPKKQEEKYFVKIERAYTDRKRGNSFEFRYSGDKIISIDH